MTVTHTNPVAPSIAAVLSRDGSKAIGTAFLVNDAGLIVTCAHVLEQAGFSPGLAFSLVMHSQRITAQILDGWYWDRAGDIAFAALDSIPAGARPVRLGGSKGSRNHRFASFGFPLGHAGISAYGWIGDRRAAAYEQVQLYDSREITSGFSGAPLFDEQTRCVIGMIVSITAIDGHGRLPSTSFAIPSESICAIATELLPSRDCPYRDLMHFTEDDRRFWHGRQRLCDRASTLIATRPSCLAVFGPSGSGKSSFLRAGLIPIFRELARARGETCSVVVSRPVDSPFSSEAVVTALASQDMLVLIIDQLEDVFVSFAPDRRRAFFGALLDQARRPATWLVLGMRDDFYSHLAREAPLLFEFCLSGLLQIPMYLTLDDLRAIIRKPAEQVGMVFDPPDLDNTIALAVVQARSGPERETAAVTVLPLLQVTLMRMWNVSNDGVLRATAFTADKLTSALSERAHEVYAGLSPGQQELADLVLIELIDPARSNALDKGARVSLERLRSQTVNPANLVTVLQAFIDARIVVALRDPESGREVVELIHDSLITNWDHYLSLLRDAKYRELIGLRLDVERAAAKFAVATSRAERRRQLLSKDELRKLARWRSRGTGFAEPVEKLVSASLAFRTAIRRLWGAAILAVTCIAALIGYLFYARTLSDTRAQLAVAQHLHQQGLAALGQRDGASAAAYLAAALTFHDTADTRAALVQARGYAPSNYWNERLPGRVLAISPDARKVAFAVREPKRDVLHVGLWDVPARRVLRVFDPPASTAAAFTPDGTRLAYAGTDGDVWIVAVAGGEKQHFTEAHGGKPAHAMTFDRAGAQLAVGRGDGTVTVFGLTGQTRHDFADSDGIHTIAFSPDGWLVAVGGSSFNTTVWNIASRARVFWGHHEDVVQGVAFEPSGRRLVSGGADGAVLVWATSPTNLGDNGEATPLRRIPMVGAVRGVEFDNSAQRPTLAIGMEDGAVQLWNFEAEQALRTLRGSGDSLVVVRFSSDGERVFAGGLERALQIWELRPSGGRLLLYSPEGGLQCGAFVPSDNLLLTGSNKGAIREWRLDHGAGSQLLRQSPASVTGIAVTATGWIATSGDKVEGQGSVFYWQRNDIAHVRALPHDANTAAVAFESTGTTLASIGVDRQVRLWRIPEGEMIGQPRKLTGMGLSVVFDPGNAAVMATGDGDSVTSLWQLADSATTPTIVDREKGEVWGVSFSPDGALLASGGVSRRVHVWRVANLVPVRTFAVHKGTITSVAFGADGDLLASAGLDTEVYLARVSTGMAIALRDHWSPVWWVAMSADGRYLASGGLDGVLVVWDLQEIDRVMNRASAQELAAEVAAMTGLHLDAEAIVSCERCGNVSW